MNWKRKTGIMLALDGNNRRAAFELLDLVGEDIDVIKFNYPLILSEGLSLIGEIKERYRKPIMADFKVADVPVTNNRIIRIAREAGAGGRFGEAIEAGEDFEIIGRAIYQAEDPVQATKEIKAAIAPFIVQ